MTFTKTPARFVTAALLGATIMLPMSAAAIDAGKTKVTAEVYGEKVSVTVPMDMLATEEGASKLYAALDRRAEKSCKITIPQKIGHSVSLKRCKSELMDDFVTEINHETLTELHQKA